MKLANTYLQMSTQHLKTCNNTDDPIINEEKIISSGISSIKNNNKIPNLFKKESLRNNECEEILIKFSIQIISENSEIEIKSLVNLYINETNIDNLGRNEEENENFVKHNFIHVFINREEVLN